MEKRLKVKENISLVLSRIAGRPTQRLGPSLEAAILSSFRDRRRDVWAEGSPTRVTASREASVVKPVANLRVDFAWVQVVCSAEGETVVEQNAAVGDVDALQVDGESFSETLAESKVKSSVGLEMVARDIRIAVGESRSVVDVR
jgi:hypothetical protein